MTVKDIRMGLTVTAVLLQMNYYLKKQKNITGYIELKSKQFTAIYNLQ